MAEKNNTSPLAPLSFLIGQWEAQSSPGEPTGGFTFAPDLLGQVMLRTNYADYPAAPDHPAFRHEDLMVLYMDGAQTLRADYYDSEGHVIRYTGEISGTGQVAFTSEPTPDGPGFRLAYRSDADGMLTGTFEIALPQQSGKYAPYLSWTARKLEVDKHESTSFDGGRS